MQTTPSEQRRRVGADRTGLQSAQQLAHAADGLADAVDRAVDDAHVDALPQPVLRDDANRLDDRRRRRSRRRSTCSASRRCRPREAVGQRVRRRRGSSGRRTPRCRCRRPRRASTRTISVELEALVVPRAVRRLRRAAKLGSRNCSNRFDPPSACGSRRSRPATEPTASTISASAIAGGASCRWCRAVQCVHRVPGAACGARCAGAGAARVAVKRQEHEAEHVDRRQQRREQADGPQQRVAARERAEQDLVLAEEPGEPRHAGDRERADRGTSSR